MARLSARDRLKVARQAEEIAESEIAPVEKVIDSKIKVIETNVTFLQGNAVFLFIASLKSYIETGT